MFEDSCFKIGEQVFITITRFEGPHPSWIVWYFSFSNFWWVLQWFLCVQCICQLYSVIFAWRAGISAPSVWVSTQYVARKTSWLNCLGIVNESNKKSRIINNVFRLYYLLTSSRNILFIFISAFGSKVWLSLRSILCLIHQICFLPSILCIGLQKGILLPFLLIQ